MILWDVQVTQAKLRPRYYFKKDEQVTNWALRLNFTDPDCQVAETITIEALPNEPSSDSTPSTSGTTQSESNYFKFPAVDINEFITNMPETTYLDDVTEDESAYLSCSSSQYSPTVPPTPSTASSVDSNSSHIPSFLKQGLKQTIQSRRLQEGKGMLEVEFKEPEPECVSRCPSLKTWQSLECFF